MLAVAVRAIRSARMLAPVSMGWLRSRSSSDQAPSRVTTSGGRAMQPESKATMRTIERMAQFCANARSGCNQVEKWDMAHFSLDALRCRLRQEATTLEGTVQMLIDPLSLDRVLIAA